MRDRRRLFCLLQRLGAVFPPPGWRCNFSRSRPEPETACSRTKQDFLVGLPFVLECNWMDFCASRSVIVRLGDLLLRSKFWAVFVATYSVLNTFFSWSLTAEPSLVWEPQVSILDRLPPLLVSFDCGAKCTIWEGLGRQVSKWAGRGWCGKLHSSRLSYVKLKKCPPKIGEKSLEPHTWTSTLPLSLNNVGFGSMKEEPSAKGRTKAQHCLGRGIVLSCMCMWGVSILNLSGF